MKKTIAILLALLVALSLAACGGSASKKFDPEEELRSKISADVAVYCKFNYADVKLALTTISDISNNGDTYTAKGKVNITDNYGDKYSGKVTGVYKLEGEAFTKVSLDIEQPRKQ